MEGEKAGVPAPTSWQDLTESVYKNHIIMPNPSSSGTSFLDVSSWHEIYAARSRLILLLLAVPLWSVLSRSLADRAGEFVGLANYLEYFDTPALFRVAGNSLVIATLTACIVVSLAFIYLVRMDSRGQARKIFPRLWLGTRYGTWINPERPGGSRCLHR